MAEVAIITVNYNGARYLPQYFQSIFGQTYKSIKLIVIDNNSSDGSQDLLKQHNNIIFVQNQSNIGFAAANNQGLRYLDSDTKYIFLLNNDTRLDSRCIEELVRAIKKDNKIGAVSPKMLLYHPFIKISVLSSSPGKADFHEDRLGKLRVAIDGELALDYSSSRKYINGKFMYYQNGIGGGEYWWVAENPMYVPLIGPVDKTYKLEIVFNSSREIIGKRVRIVVNNTFCDEQAINKAQGSLCIDLTPKLLNNSCYLLNNVGSYINKHIHVCDIGFGQEDAGQYNQPHDIEAFCGGAVFIKRELLQRDIFNGYFFVYYEDVDLSYKIRKMGYRLVYSPQARVYHYLWGWWFRDELLSNYYYVRNRLIFIMRNYSGSVITREFLKHLLKGSFFGLKYPRVFRTAICSCVDILRNLRRVYE